MAEDLSMDSLGEGYRAIDRQGGDFAACLSGWLLAEGDGEYVATVAAGDIDSAGEKARYDQAVKRLLANTPFLARILKHTLSDVADMEVIEIEKCIDQSQVKVSAVQVMPGFTNRPEGGENVLCDGDVENFTVQHSNGRIVGQSQEDAVPYEGRVFFDIRFDLVVPKKEPQKVIVNIEAQRQAKPGYSLVKRGIFYAARLLSAQLGTEFLNNREDKAQYDNIKKVTSIWICMECPVDLQDSIVSYSIEPKILHQAGENLSLCHDYDILNVTMVYLNTDGSSVNKLIGMLDVLLGNLPAEKKKLILEQEYDIPMSVKVQQEVADVCNLSAGVEARGEARGRAIGFFQAILMMLRKGRITEDQAAEDAGMTLEEFRKAAAAAE